jgi:hypothetical protein
VPTAAAAAAANSQPKDFAPGRTLAGLVSSDELREALAETVGEAREMLHADVRDVHVELLRQFELMRVRARFDHPPRHPGVWSGQRTCAHAPRRSARGPTGLVGGRRVRGPIPKTHTIRCRAPPARPARRRLDSTRRRPRAPGKSPRCDRRWQSCGERTAESRIRGMPDGSMTTLALWS